jgi:hypothetical protein
LLRQRLTYEELLQGMMYPGATLSFGPRIFSRHALRARRR